MRILLVEDDEAIASTLVEALTEQRYAVDTATDGQLGLELAESVSYDLIVLDMMLPKLDGLSVCRRLRSRQQHMPILLLTSRDTPTDKVMGLDAGADDYVVKPFNLSELSARIRALLRRGESPAAPILQWGDISLDPTTCQVSYAGDMLHLSPKEYSLLELFLRNSRRVFSRTAILDHLWSFEDSPAEDTVKAHIKGLRQKLKAAGVPELIDTVYGLGYRLKPLEQIVKSGISQMQHSTQGGPRRELVEGTANGAKQAKMKAVITKAWKEFKGEIFRRVGVIEQAEKALQMGNLGDDLCRLAEREAHKLAGSVGMFGFEQATAISQKLEHLFQAGVGFVSTQVAQVSELIVTLQQELEKPPVIPAAVAQKIVQASVTQDDRPLLFIIDDDTQLAAYLAQEGTAWGMRTLTAPNPTLARQLVQTDRPDIVLLDLSFADTAEEGLTLLKELTAATPPIPVLVFTARHGFTDRVAVARLGGRTFLQKPIAPPAALEVVSRVLQHTRKAATRILIVDDDQQILTATRNLLEPWGFQITTLNDPLQFWHALDTTLPELLVLDVGMPQLDGIELCQVVRNDPTWGWLPILFMTAHTNEETIQRVFAVGADDYISKPIAGPELLTRITNRLDRTKLLRSMAEMDILTGTTNQQKSTQDINRFLLWAKQSSHSVCLAVVGVDHLSQVNEQHGHAIGDKVLQRLGKLFHQAFQGEDIVARWGGASFVVSMYGMTRRDGVERLAEVLETFRQQEFVNAAGTSFQVSFSAGVAEYPADGTDLQGLSKAATDALEQAKAFGHSRVHPAGWQPLQIKSVPHFDVVMVSDDATLATQLLQALTIRGYHFQWLHQGESVETTLIGAPPSLRAKVLVLSTNLPGLDSLKLLKRMGQKNNVQRPRTIALTVQSVQAEALIQAGAYDYLTEPYRLSILLQRIRRALEA